MPPSQSLIEALGFRGILRRAEQQLTICIRGTFCTNCPRTANSRCGDLLRKHSEAESASHTPPEDRQARLSGAGESIFAKREIPRCFRYYRKAGFPLCEILGEVENWRVTAIFHLSLFGLYSSIISTPCTHIINHHKRYP